MRADAEKIPRFGLLKRSILRTCATLLVVLLSCFSTGCQPNTGEYPNRSIELIVPWAAGGGTDRLARFIADALQRKLQQPVIVVNRTGGSGAVGHSAGAFAPADGYTLTMGTFELSTMRSMGISKLTWQDFTPVAQINGDAAAVIVHHNAPWRSLADLLNAVRGQPGKLKMSGTATGGAWDLARTGLLLAAGISPRDVIWAPTQGSAPALVELLGGHIDAVCCSVPEAASQIEAKQARVLAVLSAERLAQFPDFPTAREQGIDYEAVGWRGIMLPKNTPAQISTVLNKILFETAGSAAFREFMNKNGFAIVVRGPAEFTHYLAEQELKWREVIDKAGYQTLGQNHDPGPKALPIALAVLLIAVLIAEMIASRRREDSASTSATAASSVGSGALGAAPPGLLSKDALVLLAALVIYIAIMPWIGFAVSTLLFALVVMCRLGAKWWLAAVCSLAIIGIIHGVFVILFKVQLP